VDARHEAGHDEWLHFRPSILPRHSGARISANPESRRNNLEIPGSMLRIAPE
jgi:hypothetical protein